MHTRRSATRAREHMPPLGGCMSRPWACVRACRHLATIGASGLQGAQASEPLRSAIPASGAWLTTGCRSVRARGVHNAARSGQHRAASVRRALAAAAASARPRAV